MEVTLITNSFYGDKMNPKFIAIGVAAIIVAAGAAVLLMPKESKGWYSWDPTVGEVDYTMISATPKIMDVLEDMYSIVYGELPSRETEVPASQLLEYESLVTDTATGIDVQSRSSILPLPSTFEDTVSLTDSEIQNMKIISYSSGLTDCFVSMLGEEQVWDTVVAAGNSTWTNYPDNDMEKWGENSSLGPEYTISTEYLLSYLDYAGAKTNGYHYCVVAWGYIKNYDDLHNSLAGAGFKDVDIICIDYYEVDDFNYLLSIIDAMGRIIGIDPEDNEGISDFQERLYTVKKAVSGKETGRTVYLENPSKKSPGKGTLTELCFDALGLVNINTEDGLVMLNDESIVSDKPSVIFFSEGDTRTMDQKMRVTM